jgi:hypothetical protein
VNTKIGAQWGSMCFFVLCNRHRFDRAPGANLGIACPPFALTLTLAVGRGWHGADARVCPRGLRGARERGAPGRGGGDGRDGGGCRHTNAGRPYCGPERRGDPSGQARSVTR